MRVLHAVLSDGFYGSERYCIELATAQARAGHQVEVLTTDGASDCARIFRREVTATATTIGTGGDGRIGLTVIPKWAPIWLHRSLAGRTIGRFKPDLVHSHLNPAGRRVGRV